MRPISIVSCACATPGMMEIANVRQINPLLIAVVLEAAQAYDPTSPIWHGNRTPHRSDVQFVPNMEQQCCPAALTYNFRESINAILKAGHRPHPLMWLDRLDLTKPWRLRRKRTLRRSMRGRLVFGRGSGIRVGVSQGYDPRHRRPDLLIGEGAAPCRHQVTGALATEGDRRVQHVGGEIGAIAQRWCLAAPTFAAVTIAAAGAGDYFDALGDHRGV